MRAGWSHSFRKSFRALIQTRGFLLVAMMLFASPIYAKKPNPGADEAPVRLPSQEAKPKWKNLAQLQREAAKGDAPACFELGQRYLLGEGGVLQDLTQALALLEQAANGGIADAAFRLGKIYNDGDGVPPNYERSLEFYTLAARAGVLEALHNIGTMLVSGRGVKRDYVEGLAWLILATKAGDTSGVEAQVRERLVKRPKSIEAAETRAAELVKDLAHATVNAELINTSMNRPVKLDPPKFESTKPVPVETQKPVIAPPKLDAPDPRKIPSPTNPPAATSLPTSK